MKEKYVINAQILTDSGVIHDGGVRISGSKIDAVFQGLEVPKEAEVIDAGGSYLCPGFIDLHVHGGNGSDFMDATEEDFGNIAVFHAAHGTTSMLATTLTSSEEELEKAINCFNHYKEKERGGAQLLGLHLEGPYFNREQKGAQDERFLRPPTPEHYGKILGLSPYIRRVSAAPELDEGWGLADYCARRDIILSAGHSSCTTRQAQEAFEKGYRLITHFYSGMNGVTRRNCFRVGGLVEAGYLVDDMKVEIIADGCHLPPELLELIYKIKSADNIALVTDCTSAAGMAADKAVLGSRKIGQPVIVKDGVAYLPDMTAFAGSIATADRLLETMLNNTSAGLIDAVKMLTATPARILGLEKSKGYIQKGCDADLVLFDYKDNKVIIRDVFIGGRHFQLP
jgi:N-acetylglucosamine-6-phosphate deacetylase